MSDGGSSLPETELRWRGLDGGPPFGRYLERLQYVFIKLWRSSMSRLNQAFQAAVIALSALSFGPGCSKSTESGSPSPSSEAEAKGIRNSFIFSDTALDRSGIGEKVMVALRRLPDHDYLSTFTKENTRFLISVDAWGRCSFVALADNGKSYYNSARIEVRLSPERDRIGDLPADLLDPTDKAVLKEVVGRAVDHSISPGNVSTWNYSKRGNQ
jgi:hypothetical protein